MTDREIIELAKGAGIVTGENQRCADGDYRFRSVGTPTNVFGKDLIAFARAAILLERERTPPVGYASLAAIRNMQRGLHAATIVRAEDAQDDCDDVPVYLAPQSLPSTQREGSADPALLPLLRGLLDNADMRTTWTAFDVDIVRRAIAEIERFADPSPRPGHGGTRGQVPPQPEARDESPEPCPRGRLQQPEPSCTNRHQCWEPCGLLGKSAEHARIAGVHLTGAGDKTAPKACRVHPERECVFGPCMFGGACLDSHPVQGESKHGN